jgi:hyperosmotically inducible protein
MKHVVQIIPTLNGRLFMNRIGTIAILALGLSGCNRGTDSTTTPKKADNTAVNERDRNPAAKTPIDQNENQADIDITAAIRKRVVDTKMSINGQNVKIITQNGKVTLRGPVETADEKAQIEGFARAVAGDGNILSELSVK